MSTASMFVPREQRTSQNRLVLTDPPKDPIQLSEKYRPQRFADMLGQGYAVQVLQDFVDAPYPQSFVFSGHTGTGKSTAAMALARELGVNFDWNYLCIKSGEMNDDAVTMAYKMMRQCGIGDGWKLIQCDEADMATTKAKGLWLSILEDIPRNSVIVFTTNHLDKFDQRFIDRCEHIKFESHGKTLLPEAQSYLNRIWVGESMPGNPPNVEDCKGIMVEGVLSFRRIARFVEQAKHQRTVKVETVRKVVRL